MKQLTGRPQVIDDTGPPYDRWTWWRSVGKPWLGLQIVRCNQHGWAPESETGQAGVTFVGAVERKMIANPDWKPNSRSRTTLPLLETTRDRTYATREELERYLAFCALEGSEP